MTQINTVPIPASQMTNTVPTSQLSLQYQNLIFTHWLTGNASAAADKFFWIVPVACTVTDIRAYATTAPTTQSLIIDVNKRVTGSAVTLFTTQGSRPTIAAAANASSTTLPDITTLVAGDVVSYDIDQVGSGTVGAGVMITITVKTALVA